MNHLERVNSTAHWFGEHRPDPHSLAFRHRNVDETPLVIALALAVLVVAALIWCCVSTSRAKRSSYSDYDAEAVVANGLPFTNLNALHDPRSGRNSKFLRSMHIRTRSVTLPHTVYSDPFQHRVSLSPLGIGGSQRSEYMDIGGRQRERSRSLSSLPALPVYRPDAGSPSTLFEHDLHPPPKYSSPPVSPSNSIAMDPSTPEIAAQLFNGSRTGHETTFSGRGNSSTTSLPSEPVEPKEFPLSLSQPTITEIPSVLNRALSSPGRYTANRNVSKATLYPPKNDLFYGTHSVFVDQLGRIVLPRIPDSDSIVTISPCDMVSSTENQSVPEAISLLLPSHSDNSIDRAFKDSSDTIVPLAGEFSASEGISQFTDCDEGGQESKLAHIVRSHEANQMNETDLVEIGA